MPRERSNVKMGKWVLTHYFTLHQTVKHSIHPLGVEIQNYFLEKKYLEGTFVVRASFI